MVWAEKSWASATRRHARALPWRETAQAWYLERCEMVWDVVVDGSVVDRHCMVVRLTDVGRYFGST